MLKTWSKAVAGGGSWEMMEPLRGEIQDVCVGGEVPSHELMALQVRVGGRTGWETAGFCTESNTNDTRVGFLFEGQIEEGVSILPM